jgi:hypothetical protein
MWGGSSFAELPLSVSSCRMFGRIVVASVVAEIASSPNARGYADLDWTALGLIAAKIRRSHAMKKMNAKSLANLVRWPGASGFIRQRRVGNKLPYDFASVAECIFSLSARHPVRDCDHQS